MVNDNKVKRKLPSLLIDDAAYGDNPEYQRKTRNINRLQRKQPTLFGTLFNNISIAIDELDKAAEQSGFQQVYIEDGKLKKKWKYRTN